MAVTLVQQQTGSVASSTSGTATITANANNNTLLLNVTRSGGSATGSITNVTDTASNLWVRVTRGALSGATNTRNELWACYYASPTTAVTFTSSSSQPSAWIVTEWAGIDSADVVSADYSSSASSTTPATPSITPTAGDMLYASAHFPLSSGGTPSAGWTALTNFDDSVGSGRAAYQLSAAGTSVSCTWSTLASSEPAGVVIVALSPSAGSGLSGAVAVKPKATITTSAAVVAGGTVTRSTTATVTTTASVGSSSARTATVTRVNTATITTTAAVTVVIPVIAPVYLSQWDSAVTRGGAILVNYVDVYSQDGTYQGTVYPKPGTGTVTQDFVTGTRWHLTASFTPDASSLLVAGAELRPFTGFHYSTGLPEVVQLGCFPLTSSSSFTLSTGASIDVTCLDRWQWITGSTFLTPYSTTPKLTVSQQLTQLVLDTGMWTIDEITNTISSTANPGVQTWDTDRSQAIGDLCASVGAEAFMARDGTFVLQDREALGASQVTLQTGDGGRLIDATFTIDTSTVYNVVTIVPSNTDPNFILPQVTVRITDPKHPAYPRAGVMFTSILRLDSALYTSTAQARAAAQKMLSKVSAKAELGSLVCMPDATLEAGDTVTVILPDGTTKIVQIQQITYPLNVTDEQSITTVSTRGDEVFAP